jgi:hypothetical protein
MRALTNRQAKRLARAWAGRMLQQLDAMGEPDTSVISDEDYVLVGEHVKELGWQLLGSNPVGGSTLDSIALALFPKRK